MVLPVHRNEVLMKNRTKEHTFLFQIFSQIAHDWNLTEKEQLGLLNVKSVKALKNLESGKKVPPEEIFRRIGYLMNIRQALKVLLPDTYAANTWIRRKNSATMFKGRPAVKLMASDASGIKKVRDYLLGEIGGPL